MVIFEVSPLSEFQIGPSGTSAVSTVWSLLSLRVENVTTTLREHLRTHKIFTKDQCFYLNYSKFSIKSYVLDMYLNRLGEAILIHIHNI